MIQIDKSNLRFEIIFVSQTKLCKTRTSTQLLTESKISLVKPAPTSIILEQQLFEIKHSIKINMVMIIVSHSCDSRQQYKKVHGCSIYICPCILPCSYTSSTVGNMLLSVRASSRQLESTPNRQGCQFLTPELLPEPSLSLPIIIGSKLCMFPQDSTRWWNVIMGTLFASKQLQSCFVNTCS